MLCRACSYFRRKVRAHKEGELAEIPNEYAEDYMRCGFITLAVEPAVKVVSKPKGNVAKAVK
jgi:hypothetical protein